jgi:hypothetical protein
MSGTGLHSARADVKHLELCGGHGPTRTNTDSAPRDSVLVRVPNGFS